MLEKDLHSCRNKSLFFCSYRYLNRSFVLTGMVVGVLWLRALKALCCWLKFCAFFLAPFGISRINLKKYGSWAGISLACHTPQSKGKRCLVTAHTSCFGDMIWSHPIRFKIWIITWQCFTGGARTVGPALFVVTRPSFSWDWRVWLARLRQIYNIKGALDNILKFVHC